MKNAADRALRGNRVDVGSILHGPNSGADPWHQRLVSLGADEIVPLQLQMGSERIEVWLDAEGLHFRQPGGNAPLGYLPWEQAIAMSLVPQEWRSLLPSA